jgi:hypothetical protein
MRAMHSNINVLRMSWAETRSATLCVNADSLALRSDPGRPVRSGLGGGGRVRSATAPGQQAIVGASVIFRRGGGHFFFFLLTAAKHRASKIGLPFDIELSDVHALHREDRQSF